MSASCGGATPNPDVAEEMCCSSSDAMGSEAPTMAPHRGWNSVRVRLQAVEHTTKVRRDANVEHVILFTNATKKLWAQSREPDSPTDINNKSMAERER